MRLCRIVPAIFFVLPGSALGQSSLSLTDAQTIVAASDDLATQVDNTSGQVDTAIATVVPRSKVDLSIRAGRARTCSSSTLTRTLSRLQLDRLRMLQSQASSIVDAGPRMQDQFARNVADLTVDVGDFGVVCAVMSSVVSSAESSTLGDATVTRQAMTIEARLRAAIAELRDLIAVSAWPQTFTYTDGSGFTHTVTLRSRRQALSLLAELESMLEAITDEVTKDLIQLQAALQNLSRHFTALAQVTRAAHDVAMNTIRNMKG